MTNIEHQLLASTIIKPYRKKNLTLDLKYTGNGICISRQRQQNSINKLQSIPQMFYHILVHWHTYLFTKKPQSKVPFLMKTCFVAMKVFTDLFQYDIASPCNKPSLHLPSLSRLLFRPGLKVVHKPPRNLWKFLRQTMRWTRLHKTEEHRFSTCYCCTSFTVWQAGTQTWLFVLHLHNWSYC